MDPLRMPEVPIDWHVDWPLFELPSHALAKLLGDTLLRGSSPFFGPDTVAGLRAEPGNRRQAHARGRIAVSRFLLFQGAPSKNFVRLAVRG